jgi:hypothetical protein
MCDAHLIFTLRQHLEPRLYGIERHAPPLPGSKQDARRNENRSAGWCRAWRISLKERMVRLPPAVLGEIPDEPGPTHLPTFYWSMLRGSDAMHAPTQPVPRRSRVVLLHGWLQDHTCWLSTAVALRDSYSHDVLLMDFYGHGRSPYLSNYRHMNIHTSTRQLRRLLQHVIPVPTVLAS